MKYQTRFVSQKPAKVVLSSMEVVAQSMGFKTHIRNYKVMGSVVVYTFGAYHHIYKSLLSFYLLFNMCAQAHTCDIHFGWRMVLDSST